MSRGSTFENCPLCHCRNKMRGAYALLEKTGDSCALTAWGHSILTNAEGVLKDFNADLITHHV